MEAKSTILKSGIAAHQLGTLPDWAAWPQIIEWKLVHERRGVKRMVEWVTGKAEYTEEEAASALGVSIDELRKLVRTHVIKEEAGMDVPIPTFRPTDLLLLKMLSDSRLVAG